MSKLQFDDDNRVVRGGVDHVVLYPKATNYAGVAWDGVTEINVNPNGGDVNSIWADNICYAKIRGKENFAGSIKAYDYPDEWRPCVGIITPANYLILMAGQDHSPFNMCYRTKTYDKTGVWVWSTYHVLFGLTAGTSEDTAKTLEEGFDPAEFTFDFEGTPVKLGSSELFGCEYLFDVPVKDGTEWTGAGPYTVNGRTFTADEIKTAAAYLNVLYGTASANAVCADTSVFTANRYKVILCNAAGEEVPNVTMTLTPEVPVAGQKCRIVLTVNAGYKFTAEHLATLHTGSPSGSSYSTGTTDVVDTATAKTFEIFTVNQLPTASGSNTLYVVVADGTVVAG